MICANVAALSQYIESSPKLLDVRIGRHGSHDGDDTLFYTAEGIIEHSDQDQVVVVHSGTTFSDLKRELSRHGQVLPFAEATRNGHQARGDNVSVGQVAAFETPHPGEGLTGKFRDWVLGLTVAMADGAVIKCGSKAVKSVAGYDLQKLFLGARHSLGVITQLTLRTYSSANFERLQFEWTRGEASGPDEELLVQRTLRTDFDQAVAAVGGHLALADHGSSTLWCYMNGQSVKRFPHDWIHRPFSAGSVEIENPQARAIMGRIKQLLDPGAKFPDGGFKFD